jgi:transglutaminase-like putative cysteine protease
MLRRSLASLPVLLLSVLVSAQSPKSRHFIFHYAFTVRNVSPGQPMRVWIPTARSTEFQSVRVVSQSGDLPLKRTREKEYGNETFYAEVPKATRSDYQFGIAYDVVRREQRVLVDRKPVQGGPHEGTRVQLTRFLQPDKLVPITGVPAQLAGDQTKDATTQLDKARDLYEYVFRTMKYDKTGTGWGHGDTLWACDSKRGNCTDFHSLFISMSRSQHIAARFEIGFPLPAGKNAGDVAGYHCWADFYVDSIGWIPVDISEAWKHPELRDYYFGQRDANRVEFTVGRDLTLNPKQNGPPLNYFVYPYVEVGGKEHPNVSIAFSFKDADTTEQSSVIERR